MPTYCVAVGCRQRPKPESNVKFYIFPRDPLRKKRWVSSLRRDGWTPTPRSRICSVHFISGRQSDDPASPDYVPSWFAHTTTAEKERSMAAMRRYRRCQGARIRKATGGTMSPLERAALDYFKSGLVPTGSDQRHYSCFPSLCQEYVKKSFMESQTSSGSSETPAYTNPAARSSNNQHRQTECPPFPLLPKIKPLEENPYLKTWLRHDYNPRLKPKSVDQSSYLSTNGTLNIPSVSEITVHPTRLHEDYCTRKSVQWAKGVWKKVENCVAEPNYSIKVTGKWEWLSLNVRGPLPETHKGHRFLLIITDLYSKWGEACPMCTSSAREVALNIRNLVCQLGLPHALFSQLSRMFIKAVNKALGIYMAMEDCALVVYHPKACSLDPVTYTDVNSAVTKLVEECQESWDVHLRSCLFALRIKRHPVTGKSPFCALYHRDPQKDSPDALHKLAEGLSDEHPISRILASPTPIDTQGPPPSGTPAAVLAPMGVSIVLIPLVWRCTRAETRRSRKRAEPARAWPAGRR
ncbi:uncharacterized protein LOC133113910 isoform X2 [Conger conger]|uniref:uncharacterized protein LOC133113910 isoform X2 n=1 Tax=Conger conger TaxID=82655 RepID=UPI002A59ABD7|nr:uncharacterized protein LOC133113910 isoform X2 [Conger conger]